ncbi:hypothetical protein ABZ319_23530 [Nocardia sp. NPDC005978]|uniref:hypothetical protein n=1 Tax=Nocardia sp. NPDC005978 TaxID=3156725 RepID=UPI0033B31D32
MEIITSITRAGEIGDSARIKVLREVMVTEQDSVYTDLHDRLQSIGIGICGEAPVKAPSLRMIRETSGYEIKPTATVEISDRNAMNQLDSIWNDFETCSPGHKFLLRLPLPAFRERGWIFVSDSIGQDLPSRISRAFGGPDLTVASTSGDSILAIIEDEYKYLIVKRTLTDEDYLRDESAHLSQIEFEASIRSLIENKITFSDLVGYLRDNGGQSSLKPIGFMRLLNQVAGISASSTRDAVLSVVDHDFAAVIPDAALEDRWLRLISGDW